MRWLLPALFFASAGFAVFVQTPAVAQSNPYRRYAPRAPYYHPPAQAQQRREPTSSPYSVPPGYTGTIYWNTPNADGNFGAGGGGSAGSPGG